VDQEILVVILADRNRAGFDARDDRPRECVRLLELRDVGFAMRFCSGSL